MLYMPLGKIFKDGNSIYKITLIAAKRAIELNNGAAKLVDTDSKKFSTIALQEISQGKIGYKLTEPEKSKSKK